MKATHWKPSCWDFEEMPDDVAADPIEAAKMFLGDRDSDDSWDARYELGKEGTVDIEVEGCILTKDELPEDQQFAGYEPGQQYVALTGEKAIVTVAHHYEVKHAAIPM